ncbi:TonB-dependent receptor [Luminiphilus sp.]|jgi:iron complex outermembrane receptor protein|nr:TonB-dependent receptor [Luminiphilus sp.]MDC0573100.1 TonB-dependent receptor [Luminiphilus sp.]
MNFPFSGKSPITVAVSLLTLGIVNAIPSAPLAQAQDAKIEEVIVTARKRQESLQDVPVAVTALTPNQLERGSIQRTTDIDKMVPNVELHQTYIGSESLSASIRGIGYDDIEKSLEPTVGVAVDGVFMASNSGAVFDMFDVESVEVLRGPQGTLFGRNTIGGVINVTRTKPTGEWGVKLQATFGDQDMTDVKGVLNMPLGEKGGIKLAFKNIQSDSHVYNTTLNGRRDFRDSTTVSASIRYDFTENTSVLFTYDDYDHDTIAPDNLMVGPFPEPLTGYLASQTDDYKTSPQLNPLEAYMWGDNSTLQITHDWAGHQFKYTMGIMDYEEEVHESSWGSATVFFPVNRFQDFKQTSHEFQISSDSTGPLNYVAGFYYLEADSFITSGPIQPFTVTHEAEAQAFYGELTYDFNDNWSMTLGARYTDEDKNMESFSWPPVVGDADRIANNTDPSVLQMAATPSFSDDNVTYRAVIQRNFSRGMAYASYSTGFRSGGFFNRGTTPSEVEPYDSEEVDNIEIGIRTNPTESTQLNLTYYSAEYTGMQLPVITPASFPECGKGGAAEDAAGITCSFIKNVGETSMDGIEVEGIWMPTDALTLRGSLGTLDGNYDSYDYNGADISGTAQLLYAPELTWSVGAEHVSEILGGELILTANYSFQDEVYTQTPWAIYDPATFPKITIDDWESLDVSATYLRDTANGTFKVILYGTDVLEDGNRVQRRYTTGSFTWAEIAPRQQFGITIGYEF